jgi:hypothetical protein
MIMAKTLAQTPEDSWTRSGGSGFGQYQPRDEELHPEHFEPHDSLTETWAYMFWMPKQRIGCIVYLWVHPNLKVLTGGLTVYRGDKSHQLQSEIFDMTIFNSSERCIHDNGRDIRLPNGLQVQILEPFKTMRVQYQDEVRGNLVDLTFTAAAPPVMRASNKHFEQMVDVRGALSLRGKSHTVDCWGSRDRSWGEPRPESNYPIPPYTWMTGRFPNGMMFSANGHDDPKRNPEWKKVYKVAPKDLLKDGWLRRDGEQLRISNYSKITRRDPLTRRPLRHDISFTDSKGRDYRIKGKIIASTPWGGWFNINCFFCVTKWTWGKEVGYGDTQEVSWGDYNYQFRKDQA